MVCCYDTFWKYYDRICDQLIDYAFDCELLETLFEAHGIAKPTTILDIGSGTGSHAIELARRGYALSGIDISEAMIAQAKEKAHEAALTIDFQVQDMRSMRFERPFDAAICLFGGFGYLGTDEEVDQFLNGLHDSLSSSGLVIIEFWQWGGLVPGRTRWVQSHSDEHTTITVRLSDSIHDADANIMKLTMDFFEYSGSQLIDSAQELHLLRCYTVEEIERLFIANGFTLLAVYDRDLNELGMKEPIQRTFRILAVARRLPEDHS